MILVIYSFIYCSIIYSDISFISLNETDLHFSISHSHLEIVEHSRHCSKIIIDMVYRQFSVEGFIVVDTCFFLIIPNLFPLLVSTLLLSLGNFFLNVIWEKLISCPPVPGGSTKLWPANQLTHPVKMI